MSCALHCCHFDRSCSISLGGERGRERGREREGERGRGGVRGYREREREGEERERGESGEKEGKFTQDTFLQVLALWFQL